MPRTPPADIRHGAVRLRTALSHLQRQLRVALPADGISMAKLSVLGQLHRAGALTPTELARREGVRLQTLTRLLAELEAEGRIARTAHERDGRQSLLSLTRSGAQELTAFVHRREASLARAIDAQLSAGEQALLLQACSLIDRIADDLAPTAAAASASPRSRAA